MGRRKAKAGRRTTTIRDLAAIGATIRLVPADAETAGTITVTTGDSAVAAVVEADHQLVEQAPVNDTSISQLQAEADAALATAPPDLLPGAAPVAPAGPSPADMEAGYAMIAGGVLDMTCEMVVPAWEVTDDEKGKLAGALGKACALWFPGEIPERWAALIVLAGVAGQVVIARRDPATGGFKPRFRPAPVAESPPAA